MQIFCKAVILVTMKYILTSDMKTSNRKTSTYQVNQSCLLVFEDVGSVTETERPSHN